MNTKLLLHGAIIVGTLAGAFLLAHQGNAQETLQVPENEMVIKGKKPARFPHAVHLEMKLKCGVCHHDSEGKPVPNK